MHIGVPEYVYIVHVTPPGARVSGCIDTHDICSEAKNCGHAVSIYDMDF